MQMQNGALAHLFPCAGLGRLVRTLTPTKFFQMPLRNRHPIRMRRDAIPQRLNVLDLILDGHGVEACRRGAIVVGHASMLPPGPRSCSAHEAVPATAPANLRSA